MPVIPAGIKWDRHDQLDQAEFTCSATQARNRWPAKAIFGRVLEAPALQGTIPYQFQKYVEEAHAVAYLNVLLSDVNVDPNCWRECKQFMDELRESRRNDNLV